MIAFMNIKERIRKIFSPIDLTKGNVTKSIIIFSIPILLSLIFQQVYSITDAAIAGQNLSANEIAGISDVGCLTYIVMDFGFGCTSGFSAITAKAFGANKMDDVKKSYSIQIVLTFIIGVILTIIGLLSIDSLLGFINIKKGNPVYEYGFTYIFIFFCGTLAQLFYNLFSNALRSIGDSTTPLLFLICSVILNIILDAAFIILFHWGVVGVAVATIITQVISAVACFIYAYKRYDVFRISIKDLNIDWKYAFEHIKNGVPLGLQFSVLAFGIIIMQGAVVNFDIASNDPTQPAQLGYGAVNKLIGALMCIPNGIGTAMLSFTGQNYGAKQYQRVREGIKKSTIITVISCFIITIISLLLCINGAFLYIFLSPSNINSQTIKYGTYYFYANMPLFFTLGLLFIGRNTLQGIEKPTFPFIAGVLELVVRVLISLYIPSLVNPSNPTSDISYFFLMSADVLAWITASIILYVGLIKNVYLNPLYKIEKKK
jgi:putative MATE family efflux protein